MRFRKKARTLFQVGLNLVVKKSRAYWHSTIWHRLGIVFIALISMCILTMYGIARWYIASQADKPYTWGVSFIPDYAESLGLNPQQTMTALLKIGVRHFRLTSYWNIGEPTPGHYNFHQLDWEFAKAEQYHAKILLTVGLRQPRWPECHAPSWVNTSGPMKQWLPQLEHYMTAVVNRYKNSPSLSAYQVENEYFLHGFGSCTNYSAQRLISEYNLVHRLDPKHPIVVSRSNNAIGFPLGQPQPSLFGISIYRKQWKQTMDRYYHYPLPAWFYGFLAGVQEIFLHKNMIIAELQAEPWPPHSAPITKTSLKVQDQTMNAQLLKRRFNFAQKTGMHTAYLWGAEYWYYRLVKLHDPSVWNIAKAEFEHTLHQK